MPFTLVCFNESKANATYMLFAALADEHITHVGNDITVPELNQIIAAYAQKTALTQFRLEAPSLRRIFLQDMAPVLAGLAIPATMPPIIDLKDNPIPLKASEKLNAGLLADGTADNGTILIWLADGKPTPAFGEIRTVRCTIPTTTTTFGWTNQALTFTQTLPAGRYAVVGARVVAANGIAFRFVFIGGSWRPGGLCAVAASNRSPSMFRNGKLGQWGEFEFSQPPSIEILCSAATGAAVVYLDLIQTLAE